MAVVPNLAANSHLGEHLGSFKTPNVQAKTQTIYI